jgi:hypothetical protein
MSSVPEKAMIALKSETSSIYSNDDRICYSSSADLQYEHRSLPHRDDTSMAHNHAQCFDRPASTLLGSEQEIIDKSGDLNGTIAPWQETNAEAEERRRRSAAIARAEARLMAWVEADMHAVDESLQSTGTIANAYDMKLKHLELTSSDEGMQSANRATTAMGPRPPTPPRCRPRVRSTEIEAVANDRSTIDSYNSAEEVSSYAAGVHRVYGRVEKQSDQVRRRHHTSEVAHVSIEPVPSLPLVPDDFATSARSIIEEDEAYSNDMQQQLDRANALQDLIGPSLEDLLPVVMGDSSQGDSRQGDSSQGHSSIVANSAQRMQRLVKPDWPIRTTNRHVARPLSGLISSTGKEYGLGDHSLGYCSGNFVTNLKLTKSSAQLPKKTLIHRFFCM